MRTGKATHLRSWLTIGVYLVGLLAMNGFPGTVFAVSGLSYSSGNVTALVEEEVALTGITVTGDDPIVPITISVPHGILYMTTTTGLTFETSTRASTLSFSGSIADLNAALATLKFRTLDAGVATLTATILDYGQVYNPSNGHMYEVINHGSNITWDDANTAAQGLTKNGASGYLATITSQAENDYLLGKLVGDGWFGASDAATEGDWRWVTGPEAGTAFWLGLGDGTPVGGLFSNWSSGEPNDAGGEDCAQFYSSGSGWNDLPCNYLGLDYYVVEYGGPGDLPTAPESVSFDITTSLPTISTVSVGDCLDLIDVYNNGTDNRYDTLSLTSNVDCTGETLSPMFDQEDPDFGFIGFRGTFNGNGNSITNISVENPTEDNYGLFAQARNAVFQNLTISGSVVGQECVGGLVGSAYDTTFTNVDSDVDVSGVYDVGGIIGCYEGENDSYTISESTASGSMSAQENAGGIIGSLEMVDEGELTLSGLSFTGQLTLTSDYNGGGILGRADVYDTASLTVTDSTSVDLVLPDAYQVGGIVGYLYVDNAAEATFTELELTGSVEGYRNVGALGGEMSSDASGEGITVSDVTSTGSVTGSDDSVGGLIGYGYRTNLVRVASSGTVTGGDDETGGLIGEAYQATITESYATGNVSGGDSLVGGLVGRNSDTTIERSYATGDVSGGERVGGLVGANGGYIIDSYARGAVSAADYQAGGLAGRCGREITRSYSTGSVTAGGGDVGGLLGVDDGCTVEDSFWDMDTSGMSTSAGSETGKSTEEMQDVDTFTDTATVGLSEAWDFDDVWQINSAVNDSYPCHQWEGGDCIVADDSDGISVEEEDAAPNSGDANNDGTPDSQQPNVASFVNANTGAYTVVETDSACALSTVQAASEASKTVQDSGYSYPSGLVNFTADCGAAGYTTQVRVIMYGVSKDGMVLRKHNPNANSYFTVEGATLMDVTIGGQAAVVATYSVQDGGSLDIDGATNGVIVDPVGLALLNVGVPNTGFRR